MAAKKKIIEGMMPVKEWLKRDEALAFIGRSDVKDLYEMNLSASPIGRDLYFNVHEINEEFRKRATKKRI